MSYYNYMTGSWIEVKAIHFLYDHVKVGFDPVWAKRTVDLSVTATGAGQFGNVGSQETMSPS